jgi:hypothetical protein
MGVYSVSPSAAYLATAAAPNPPANTTPPTATQPSAIYTAGDSSNWQWAYESKSYTAPGTGLTVDKMV